MINENPLVSIVVPCFNHEKYVVETLKSITQQSYNNIELIIIDDASTDSTVEVVADWLESASFNCLFIKHETNQGVCKTLNEGLKLSKGEYLGVCASDDVFMPCKIEKQVDILLNTSKNVGAIYTDSYLIDDRSEHMEGLFLDKYDFASPPRNNIFNRLIKGNFIPAMTVLIKKEVFTDVGYYDESLDFEDYDFYLRISKKFDWVFLDYISTKYRLHDTNLHKNKNLLKSSFNLLYKHDDVEESVMSIRLMTLIEKMYMNHEKETKEFLKLYLKRYKAPFILKWCILLGVPANFFYGLKSLKR